MKPKQVPCFLTVYLDENGKTTLSPTRKQSVQPTVTVTPTGETVEFPNPDIEVPNEALPGQRARNRAARRIVAKQNRKRG